MVNIKKEIVGNGYYIGFTRIQLYYGNTGFNVVYMHLSFTYK